MTTDNRTPADVALGFFCGELARELGTALAAGEIDRLEIRWDRRSDPMDALLVIMVRREYRCLQRVVSRLAASTTTHPILAAQHHAREMLCEIKAHLPAARR